MQVITAVLLWAAALALGAVSVAHPALMVFAVLAAIGGTGLALAACMKDQVRGAVKSAYTLGECDGVLASVPGVPEPAFRPYIVK